MATPKTRNLKSQLDFSRELQGTNNNGAVAWCLREAD
jgi:hypothetical protein